MHSTKKEWTGERLETFVFNENTVEHLHRYGIVYPYIKDKKVLDIASGEGYGTSLMAGEAGHVFGVDISAEAIMAAKSKYTAANISFLEGAADRIPLPDHSVDVVVSFETLEHHDRHEEMLREIKRVLIRNGILIMSSPDKKYYTDETGHINKFHVKELYFEEFRNLIAKQFVNSIFLSQRFMAGSLMISNRSDKDFLVYSGDFAHINPPGVLTPMYNIVIASDASVESPGNSIFTSHHWLAFVMEEISNRYTSSATWKIGKVITTPLGYIKQLIKGGWSR